MKNLKRYSDFRIDESNEIISNLTVENIDLIIDSFIENPEISTKAFSMIRRASPDLYNKIKMRSDERGISIETSTDLGDLGF